MRSWRRRETSGCPTLPSHRLAIHAPSEAAPPPWPVSTRKHKRSSVSVRSQWDIDLCGRETDRQKEMMTLFATKASTAVN